MAPDFWDDPKKAEKILAEISSKKKWTDGFDDTNNELEDAAVMLEFFQAGDASEAEMKEQFEASTQAVEELELKNMLRNKEDQLSAVMQITAGAGGTESCDWA